VSAEDLDHQRQIWDRNTTILVWVLPAPDIASYCLGARVLHIFARQQSFF